MTEIKCYRSPKTAVRSSSLEGLGLIAEEMIQQGEIIAVKVGHIVTAEHIREITDQVGDYALQIHDRLYLSPVSSEELKDLVIFINHSCDPNIGFDGQITYVAMRDIEAGEELCHDYAMERSDHYRMDCYCGSDHCRSVITGEDWKISELQKKYKHYFSTYIQNKIAKQ